MLANVPKGVHSCLTTWVTWRARVLTVASKEAPWLWDAQVMMGNGQRALAHRMLIKAWLDWLLSGGPASSSSYLVFHSPLQKLKSRESDFENEKEGNLQLICWGVHLPCKLSSLSQYSLELKCQWTLGRSTRLLALLSCSLLIPSGEFKGFGDSIPLMG